jgi:hypothetical protein
MPVGASCDPCAGGTCNVIYNGKAADEDCHCIAKCTPIAYDPEAVEKTVERYVNSGVNDLDRIVLLVLKALWPAVDGRPIVWMKIDASWDPCLRAVATLVSMQVYALAAIEQFWSAGDFFTENGSLEGLNEVPPKICGGT